MDCKKHVCEKCLKSRSHINHNKKILLEFQPNENELKEIMNNFKYYDEKIENLLKEKFDTIKKLKDKINIEKEKNDNNNCDLKIENMKNLKRLNEIIYNTYNMYNNNYFNSINVNTMLNTMLIRKEKNKKQSFIISLMLSYLVEKKKIRSS